MTLEDCMAAGMTAPEASKATGKTLNVVRKWAERAGQRWHDGRLLPVSRNGVMYPSVEAAAQALGVNASTISTNLARHGHLDRVGKRRGPAKGTFLPASAKPVAGFPSMTAAAKALGVSRDVLRLDLQRGGELIAALRMREDAAAGRRRVKERDGRVRVVAISDNPGREVTEAGRRARELAAGGASASEIAAATGVARTTARAAVQRVQHQLIATE